MGASGGPDRSGSANSGSRARQNAALDFAGPLQVTGSCFIYHPVREKATGEARVRVRGSIQKGGVIVLEIANTLHTLSAEEKADVIPLEFPLPLSDLERGIYSLNVQALDEVGGRGVVQRVDFMLQ